MTEEDKLASEPAVSAAPEPLPPVSADTEPYVPAAAAAATPVAPAPTTTVAPEPAPPAEAAPVPPVGWQAPPVVVATKGERTTLSLAAGILLILGGIGGILLGLLVATVGGSFVSSIDFSRFKNVPDLNGADPGAVAGGVVAFLGAVVVAYSIAYLLAGVGVVRNSNWARVLGIILGIISGLFWLSGVTSANSAQNAAGSGASVLFLILAVGVHAYIVVALLFFWRTKPTAVA